MNRSKFFKGLAGLSTLLFTTSNLSAKEKAVKERSAEEIVKDFFPNSRYYCGNGKHIVYTDFIVGTKKRGLKNGRLIAHLDAGKYTKEDAYKQALMYMRNEITQNQMLRGKMEYVYDKETKDYCDSLDYEKQKTFEAEVNVY